MAPEPESPATPADASASRAPAVSPARSGRADRSCVGPFAGVDAHGDDARGLDADDGVLEPLPERLASGGDHVRGPAHLDHAWLPWRQHVVDHDARPAGALHIAEFLGPAHPHAAHVDRIVLGVVAKRRGHHVRLPVRADGGDPAQSLLCEVLEFLTGEHTHAALTGQPAAAFQKSRSSTTSPSARKRSSDTPARSSLPPSVSLVCAFQGTAAWSPSTIGAPNWHWADSSSANTRARYP